MAVVRKKQDDKNLKILRETVSIGGNKQCFDCGQRGPTYVNMTIGSFVCTRCSGVLRGLTPPHRVKSISMATFSTDELEFIKSHGNDECAKTWLGLWDPKRPHTQEQNELMIDKYERKRYYLEPASPLKSLTTTTQLAPSQSLQAAHKDTKTSSASSMRTITLTPPTSLRLNRDTAKKSMISNNCPNFKQTFTPDDNSLFNPASQRQPRLVNNKNINNNISNGLTNGINQNGLSTKNGHNILLANNNNNKFTPDADFVADFSSASIFNATSNINGYNNNATKLVNGTAPPQNGTVKNANANFADFDHNPIYNAAGLPMSLSSTSNSLNSTGTFNSNSSISSTPLVDRYAALKDLDAQLREVKEKDLHGSHPNAQMPIANPFKQVAAAQQQQQQQHQQIGNPFQPQIQQTHTMGSWQNISNDFGVSNNVYSSSPQVYHSAMGLGGGVPLNNGFSQHQKNPFAASTLNSNNPFL